MGALVGAVQHGSSLAVPLSTVGLVFVLLQVLTPAHQAMSANLGDRTAAWLYDRLTEAAVRPPGMGHLEDPTLTGDLAVARDFDLGMMGPPLSISMDFIAGGLVELDRRSLVRDRAVRVRVVGAAGSGRSMARDALAASGERRVARPQHGSRARGAARCRLRVPARGGSVAGERTPLVRSARLDNRALREAAHGAARAAIRSDAAAREAGALEPASRRNGQRRRFLVARPGGLDRPTDARRSRRLRPDGRGHVDDRVRRAQLGHRRSRGASGGRAPARAGHARGRSARVGHAPGKRDSRT